MSGFSGANDTNQERESKPVDDWREPPGYLGEAVRRAKLISSRRRESPGQDAKD